MLDDALPSFTISYLNQASSVERQASRYQAPPFANNSCGDLSAFCSAGPWARRVISWEGVGIGMLRGTPHYRLIYVGWCPSFLYYQLFKSSIKRRASSVKISSATIRKQQLWGSLCVLLCWAMGSQSHFVRGGGNRYVEGNPSLSANLCWMMPFQASFPYYQLFNVRRFPRDSLSIKKWYLG